MRPAAANSAGRQAGCQPGSAGSGPRVFGEGGPANAATASITGLSFLPGGELAMSWFTGTSGLFKIDRDGNLVRIAGSVERLDLR